MHRLEAGGFVVDTPGIREFGLWDAHGTDTASLFRELRPYLGRCRFGAGCSHSHEPGCAVKEAVERGEVSRARYDSYLRLKGGH
jgi:ribosome biogenesis GTPase